MSTRRKHTSYADGYVYSVVAKAPAAVGPVKKTLQEWVEEIDAAKKAGGYAKRVAGDFTMFDRQGSVLFEIYSTARALSAYLW
jgi:hypothetical protein